MIEVVLLISWGEVGVKVNVPDPLFLKAINQPCDKVATAGSGIFPLPPIQLYVAARLASLIVGVIETLTTFSVTANWPLTVVNPAPAKDAASAADVPVPKVTLRQTPAAVVLSVK